MARPAPLAAWLVASALLVGCAGAALLQRPEQDCINPSISKINDFNFFPEDYRSIISEPAPVQAGSTVTDAADFEIKYYGTYKIVHVKRAGTKYVLYQCGTPDPTTLPSGAAAGVGPGMPSFEVPLYSVAVADTTVNGFLSELNLIDRVALASPYSVDNCFQRLVDTKSQDGCKLVTPSPYYNSTDEGAGARFAAANASMYEDADAVFVGFTADAPKDIMFPVTADPGPLNRAEWVKFIAAFFNKEVDANSVYNGIKGTYTSLKRLVESKWAASPKGGKLRVAWVTTNSSGISFRLDPYKTTLLEDAGALPFNRTFLEKYGAFASDPRYGTQYVFVPRGGDAKYAILAEADAIIDETYYVGIPSLANISATLGYGTAGEAVRGLRAFKNGDVYRWDGEQSPTGSSGWLEMAVARPDWVLMDLARAFTPAVLSDRLNVTNNMANKGPAGTDFNYLLQVGDPEERGRPRITAAKLCSTIPSCRERSAFAICPNAYRDCKSGKLQQADPTQRCNAWSVCDLVDLDRAARGKGARGGENGAGGRCAAAAGALLLGAAAAAALA